MPDPRGRRLADCHPGLPGHACLFAPLSGRAATPPPHATLGPRLGMRHVRRSPAPLGRPRPLLVLWRRQGPPPQRLPQRRLLGGRRIHWDFAGSELDAGVDPSPPSGRRPADIWIPRGVSRFTEAWDFSVSSLLRTSHISSATPSVADVFHGVPGGRVWVEGGGVGGVVVPGLAGSGCLDLL